MEKKEEIIVIAPKGCESYLTAGKEYVATKHGTLSYRIDVDYYGVGLNRVAYILLKGCPHLNGGDWIIKQNQSYKVLKSILGVICVLFCVYVMMQVPLLAVIFGLAWVCFISYMYFSELWKRHI